ncbi:MAG: cytochrome b/b6 domain-containing protein [Roseibium sp.]|uniref:ethylbenzene dehydrogenase-related protein n=1 Tax=Roseibium sp. TaxID=1936156 RepID=UPI00260926FD|nr:ethylbenzene dehydrogenase-related protein [Roseibium sp.]MCV0428513.1 cytochrome b/b6 domain-containing protein [Roseibium sp.]
MVAPRRPRSDLPTVVVHWCLVGTLIFSLVTGLRIAADMPDSSWAKAVSGVLPQGNVIVWHLWSAIGFLGLCAAYIVFLWRAGLFSRIALSGAVFKQLTGSEGAQLQWRAVNIVVYWLAFLSLIIAGITGILMDLFPSALPFASIALVHQISAWSIPVYIAVHIAALALYGGIWQVLKIVRPVPAYSVAAGAAFVAGGALAAGYYGLETVSDQALTLRKMSDLPKLDGQPDDLVWSSLDQIIIPTMRGANAPGGEIDVSVRAGYSGGYFYGLFQWPDENRSQKHLPLQKTEEGWKVVQTEFGIQDEDDYYEDKFGVMLAAGGGVAGNGSIHLGDKPLDGKPGPSGGRGLHYTTDGSIVDVWHWKSVRSGNAIMNQIDDNYFGAPMKPKAKGRYTGGYTKDPSDGGGFYMNWEGYSDGIVTPKRLPKDPSLLDQFQSVDLDPNAGDAVALFMSEADTVEFDPTLDTYPVGTIMPAVIIKGEFVGDRGDVTAVSKWMNGIWSMEVKRKLDTGSDYDIAFKKGTPTYLWVGAFNHAQTRHSQHLRPVTVTVE